jgi:hypothetical protein
MCVRHARLSGEVLPYDYWTHPRWAPFYEAQARIAYALLAKYGQGVRRALATPFGRSADLDSLDSPRFEKLCRREFKAWLAESADGHTRGPSPETLPAA